MATVPKRKFLSKMIKNSFKTFTIIVDDDEDTLNEKAAEYFADVSKKINKILKFILFIELAHTELILHQILAHYHLSIKRYRLWSLPV